MKEYKITNKNQWEHIRTLIVSTILIYLIIRIFMYIYGSEYWLEFVSAASIWYLIFDLIPQITLHLRYYSLNKGIILLYDPVSQEITLSKKDISNTFSIQSIREMIHYKTRSRTRWARLPWDIYSYSILYLNDGARYVITSLMARNLELPITDRTINKEVFIAYPTTNFKFK